MASLRDEEAGLRAVALQNAQSILVARRRAEEALREQSEWLRITLASIGDGVIATDADGRVTSTNAVADALTGWSRTDAPGRSLNEVFRIVHEATRQPVDYPAIRVLQGGATIHLSADTVLLARTGEEHPVDASVAPIRDESGATVGAVLVFRDVSERKRADLSRAHLAAIVDSSDDAIVSKTLQSVILSWNKGAERLFGYSSQEAIGQPITMLLPPDRRDEEQQILERITRGEHIEHFETVRVSKDGRRIDISLTISPIWDAEAAIVGVSNVARDISHRKNLEARNIELRARERLARQESERQKQLLCSLFMQAPTLIAILQGPDHVVELANPSICGVWGRTEAELIDRPLLDVLPELRDQIFPSLLSQVYRSGTPYVGKETPATFNRQDGSTQTLYFNFVYAPLRNAAGEVEGVFLIASEVTEQVLARNELDGLRASAESANRAKDEFLALLGHELRNPLSPILTALQLMKLRGGGGLERERTVIERQVRHLTRLVDDLLDVSRIARGKVELKEELVEIAEVVAKAIEVATPLLDQRTHTIDLDVPRRLWVQGDAIRLNQVVSNLLTNAAKYTPSGGRISVRATDEQDEVVIRVRDTGIGIAPDMLPRVFDLFVQERQAIDRSQGGLGLGLAIVRNLVEQHGGTVSAHSDGPGSGSEFVVRLPRAIVPVEPEVAADVDTACASAIAPGGAALRMLVVDDSVDAAEMLAAALSAKGYETQVAFDAPAALRIAAEFRPAMAFLDIGLPVMDGYELAARLRDLPELNGIRLFAVTGYGQESDRQHTRSAGFDHHFVKPIDLEAIEAVLSDGSLPAKKSSAAAPRGGSPMVVDESS